MARKEKKGRKIRVDMEGVESSGGGGGFHIPEGDYKMKVKSVETAVSKNDNEQLKWVFTGLEGKAKNKDFYLYTNTDRPDLLWKLKETLQALGQEVPNSVMDIDLDELEGLTCSGEVIDDEYNNQTRSKLQRVRTADDDDEEEKPTAKASKDNGKKKAAAVKLDKEEVQGMTEDELEELIETHELDVDLADHKTLRRKAGAVVNALEENDLLSA